MGDIVAAILENTACQELHTVVKGEMNEWHSKKGLLDLVIWSAWEEQGEWGEWVKED